MAVALLAAAILSGGGAQAATTEKSVATELRTVFGRSAPASDEGRGFYRNRSFKPLWVDERGPSPNAKILLTTLKEAERDGLDPDAYAAPVPADAAGAAPDRLAEFERTLTLGLIRYAGDVGLGRAGGRSAEMSADKLLEEAAAATEEEAFRRFLDGLPPRHPGYLALRKALADHRALEARGGWTAVPEGPTLRSGMTDPRVEALRRRLRVTGELTEGDDASPVFDDVLELALKRFQKRHGLDEDGALGRQTLTALNVPVQERIRQIALNMERWRHLPGNPGADHILINVAAAEMTIVDNGRTALSMRVVVGQPTRQTPLFVGRLTHMILNPTWNVPRHLAVEDVLRKIREDSRYLSKMGLRVFAPGENGEEKEVDPSTIDWPKLGVSRFPYRLRQDAGPKNAMGRMKFVLPNPDDIYLHDTPQRNLFQKARRTESSGCIRLEKPVDLAVHLLRRQPEWTRDAIEASIDKGGQQTVRIKTPFPVYFLYMTAWVGDGGDVHFAPDVYEKDQAFARLVLRSHGTGARGVTRTVAR
ncbi:MAG: L,D-transpeptidase family protein [Alphaproteobacteria bacterium]|nr:L,D-transpeptidase family protein [Alphaproteobacteria bacterium]